MEKLYNDIKDFINDCHEQLSIKQIIISMGIVKEKDFARVDFLHCIFHENDDSPSLQVKDAFFKCYACNAKGDIFKFLQLYYNLNFYESVKYLADFLNIKISNMKFTYDDRIDKLNKEWEEYQNNLDKAAREIKDLRRDYFPETIGYDPKEDYIVLPITSKTGSVLGFTKRRIDFLHTNKVKENGKFIYPKWKHSSLDDSLINLCHNIFNLQNAASEMKKKDEIIITEGPKDVIAYERLGFKNVICTCGTNNITNTFEAILPIKKIILSMDNDKAGIKSTIETIDYLSSIFDIKNIYVVILPEDKDPYDISKDELLNCYNNAIECVEFYIKEKENDPLAVKHLLQNVKEYNYIHVMRKICEIKNFSLSEAESWIDSNINKIIDDKNNNKMSEKDMLLAIARGEDVDNVDLIPIEKVKKILKMKYGIKID